MLIFDLWQLRRANKPIFVRHITKKIYHSRQIYYPSLRKFSMKQHDSVLLGAHMSVAGGIDQAYYRGASINCTAIQFFTHSNRQWHIKPLDQATIDAVQEAQKKTGIVSMVHASYLINLGSDSAQTVKKSASTLQKELELCHQLSVPTLVLHPGSGKDPQTAMKQIADALSEILDADKGTTTIALELMAGQGGQVGKTFEQLAFMKSHIKNKKRIGFCIDTCHLWAAGYDFSTEKGYHQVFKEFDSAIGFSHLKAMHMNDSKQKLGSHVDRHQEIGQGTIGLEAFRLIMNDPHLRHAPKVLETPKKELEDYAHNMKILRDLIK